MNKLFVCRHTETVYNKMGIFSGKLDTPLSEKGVLQAKEMARIIKEEKIDIVVTSSLVRSKETAGILMSSYYANMDTLPPLFVERFNLDYSNIIPIFSDERIDERSYGILEGKKKNAVRKQYGDEQLHLWRRSWNSAPDNGETLAQVCMRVRDFLEEVVLPFMYDEKNVLIVCHQNSMRAIKIIIEDISKDQVGDIEFQNGQIISFSFEQGRWHTCIQK